ncbi:MAG TPA: hypothetical protein VFF39_14275, partial [Verrucomicrobiae bacterium]|nr:hypothetical protein [Verrucomicrobiae bacterium]
RIQARKIDLQINNLQINEWKERLHMQARQQVQQSFFKPTSFKPTSFKSSSSKATGLKLKKRRQTPQKPLLKKRSSGRGPHWTGLRDEGRQYKAGDPVKESGIYEAIHEGAHREAHEVVMVKADLFPACDTCADKVRFRLVRSAPYIFSDIDFEQQE